MPTGDSVDLRQQLRAHLESLETAGVLFVPRGTPVARRLASQQIEAPVHAPEMPADPLESRRRELATLATDITTCDKCSELFSTRSQTVFGVGPLDPEVAFVGPAPGPEEDAQGEPFVGKGGVLLGRILAACGFTHNSVYLFNAIKCRPPKNRTPTNAECANCRDFFRRQFELVKPKHLVAARFAHVEASEWAERHPRGASRPGSSVSRGAAHLHAPPRRHSERHDRQAEAGDVG